MNGKRRLGQIIDDAAFYGFESYPGGCGDDDCDCGDTTYQITDKGREMLDAIRQNGQDKSLKLNLARALDDAEALLLSKHADYGPTNISKSPFGPLQGLLVRMWDKQARAAHLIDNDQDANYESLEDTFMDLLNYSAIAVLVLRKQWPDK